MTRRVVQLSARSASGGFVLMAVDSMNRERARCEVLGDDEYNLVLEALQAFLDAVDPAPVRLEVTDGGGRTVRGRANRKLGALQ